MKILDPNGREITLNARVVGGGLVTEITEPEGDYNSYGRAVMYGPYVMVLWPEGEDRHVCTPDRWDDSGELFICDDVVIA